MDRTHLFPYGSPPFEVMRAYVEFFLQTFDTLSPKQFNDLDPTIQGLLVFIPNLVAVVLGIWSLLRLVSHRGRNAAPLVPNQEIGFCWYKGA